MKIKFKPDVLQKYSNIFEELEKLNIKEQANLLKRTKTNVNTKTIDETSMNSSINNTIDKQSANTKTTKTTKVSKRSNFNKMMRWLLGGGMFIGSAIGFYFLLKANKGRSNK